MRRPRLSRKKRHTGFRAKSVEWLSPYPRTSRKGQGRRLPKEYLYFLANAGGSLLELDTHLEIALRLRYLHPDKYSSVRSRLQEVTKILNGLMRSVEQTSNI